MEGSGTIQRGRYTHDVLLHENDGELIHATKAFVTEGLEAGGNVLVHSSEDRVELFKGVLGSHPRLTYGLDQDLYLTPSSTLFAYQRQLAEEPSTTDLWVTGTVPLGEDPADHAKWARYESLVNEVLSPYPFHALCTYDTATLPESTIAAAKATHPCISTGVERSMSTEYQDPAGFLTDALAEVPAPPDVRPTASMNLQRLEHLAYARSLVRRTAVASSAVARPAIDNFVAAVNEVLVNALLHGGAPARLVFWVEPAQLVCRVTDNGRGTCDPVAGYRYPEPDGPRGLWVARQLCENIFVSNVPDRGCTVLLFCT
ncbi:MAG TPA: MEDS domain-containing protein [Nocardioidaceae bacterium]|nr:MEDS domain-containing protein [Nocardioidaceae bacterium]